MVDEITLQELNESIEALSASLRAMKDMRARHCCPVRPGMEIRVGRRGALQDPKSAKVFGRMRPDIACQLSSFVLVHSIRSTDTPPYYGLVVYERTEAGWASHEPVWIEIAEGEADGRSEGSD